MKNIENKIKTVLSDELELPLSYKQMIRTTLYTEKNKEVFQRFNFAKMALATSACLVLTTSIVFAKDISDFIKNFFSHNFGMDTAIENGYIDNSSTDYIESNGTKIRVNRFLMDNYNLNLDLSIKLDESIKQDKILRMSFPNMIITDENNNILFCQDKDTFEKYCNEYNLNYNWEELNDSHINSGSNFYIKSNESDTINLIYNIYAQNFPKSKKIIINFSKIMLSENEDIEQDNIILTGNWNLEIEVPEKFHGREEISYKVKNCSNDKIKITKAVVSETCTKFELEMEEESDLPYDLADDEETRNRKIDEYIEKQKNETYEEFLDRRKFKNEYIENERGKTFYPSKSTDQDAGYSNIEMKYLIYWQTFDLTKYDATNTLKVFFNYKGDDVVVELERE